MEIEDTKDLAKAYKQGPYAWPGGYPMYLIMSDGEAMCWKCFKAYYRDIADSTRNRYKDGWCAFGVDINDEDDDLTCSGCDDHIESAYGEEKKDVAH